MGRPAYVTAPTTFFHPRPKKCRPQNSTISAIIGADFGFSPDPYRESYFSAYFLASW
jgi:hypothetical protein